MLRTSKLQHLSCEILKNGLGIYGGFRSDAHIVLRSLFEIPMDTTDRKLDAGLSLFQDRDDTVGVVMLHT